MSASLVLHTKIHSDTITLSPYLLARYITGLGSVTTRQVNNPPPPCHHLTHTRQIEPMVLWRYPCPMSSHSRLLLEWEQVYPHGIVSTLTGTLRYGGLR